MSKPKPDKPIAWPKTKSASQLKVMTTPQGMRYALSLHLAHAEEHRRNMEWDLYWAQFYADQLFAPKEG